MNTNMSSALSKQFSSSPRLSATSSLEERNNAFLGGT